MAKILILLTISSSLPLLDGQRHASGFWAEELVVPYDRFVEEGYEVHVATIAGQQPTPDQGSLTAQVVGYTRPQGSPDHDAEDVAHYRAALDALPALKRPIPVGEITRDQLAEYVGVYISGGHGAMEDLPHDACVTRLVRWAIEDGMPLAAVCHGQSALLPVRNSHGQWPLEGYRMTAFSHEEELVTDMAGKLPFVLQVELERLGARYEKASVLWGSCVVEDRELLTGQNPHSSAALADAFVRKVATVAAA
jgi:putative intracellular protease/amidase